MVGLKTFLEQLAPQDVATPEAMTADWQAEMVKLSEL